MPDPALVAFHEIDTCVSIELELYPVLDRELPHRRDAALECFLEREGAHFELDLTGLDLGQVEHIVDQGEQVVGRGEDVLQVLGLLFVHLPEQLLAQHLGEADDRVQWRSELVRHVGQEFALVLARHLELAALLRQRRERLL